MSQEKLLELRKRLVDLERKIGPLEWDNSRNQINEFKKLELERLQVEHISILQEINTCQQP